MFDQQLDLDGGAHDIAPEHSQEHLFEFPTNLKGQTAMNTDQPTLRKRTVFEPCERHALMFARETRERRAEIMVEGGYGGWKCGGDGCSMRPGRDFFTDRFVADFPVYHIGDDQR